MLACHLLSCIFGGTENGDNKQNIQHQQSCLGRGCDLSFSWSAVQIRLVHFTPTEPYEGLIIHVDRRSGMRVGGWADGAQGCGLRSFSAPKVRLCSGLQQQPPEAAHWCCLGIRLVTASRMAKRSLPAYLFFDSRAVNTGLLALKENGGKLSCIWLFATPWTVARQAPMSLEFPRQEYWSGLPFPSAGDLSNPGIEPVSPTLAGGFFTTAPPGKPQLSSIFHLFTLATHSDSFSRRSPFPEAINHSSLRLSSH